MIVRGPSATLFQRRTAPALISLLFAGRTIVRLASNFMRI
ncbi:hypothetical protein [Azospirillum argentinense]